MQHHDVQDHAGHHGEAGEHCHAGVIQIIVNGREKTVDHREVTFQEIVRLAFPDAVFSDNVVYTVTYKRGDHAHPQGTLVEGQSVHVQNGTIFHCARTDRS